MLNQKFESLVVTLWKVSHLLEGSDQSDPDWIEIKREYDEICKIAASHGLDVDTL